MKVLFLNPAWGQGFCRSARWFAKSRGRVQRHPDYLCIAIAVLEEREHTCKFIDGAALNTSLDETRQIVAQFQPQMVVLQATTPSILSDIEYFRMCKEVAGQNCLTVMVGPHVSAEPDDTLERGQGAVDMIARGEYDYTLADIAQGDNPTEILGLSLWKEGQIIHNPPRQLIQDLDKLPFPAWHHINPAHYHDFGKLHPFITLLSGRGCEAACTFCQLPQVMYGRRYRNRSISKVVDEMEYDLNLFPKLQEVMFEDDTLTLKRHRERLQSLCQEIVRRKLKIPWSANARADITDLDLLKLMKKSGCRMLVVGFEFGSQQVLNNVRKGITLEEMRLFAQRCRQAGIRVHGCFMVGGPGETRETALQTIKFAQELGIDTAQFSGLCPYPGTEFYQWCLEQGYLVPQEWPHWVDENLEQRAIINYPQLSVEEMNQLVDKGLRDFYLRPSQMFTVLRNINSWADVKTKLDGLWSFVDYFFLSRFQKGRPVGRPG